MLEIKDIYKTFNAGTINEKRALNGVNLNLNPGDFVTIIGGNGAGKSTTLNAIAGVWGIDKGNIIIDGTDITKLSERVPDQSIIAGTNGERYDRAIATRGKDYLMVYNYTGRPMKVDFSKISGAKKNAWWYTTKDGKLEYIGEFENGIHNFQHDSGYSSGNDHILIVVDSSKDYVNKEWDELPDAQQRWEKK